MFSEMPDLWVLIKAGLISFRDTDFNLVRFNSLGLAIVAGLFLAVLIFYKLLWGRNKFSRSGSGHRIEERDKQGKLAKVILLLPKLLLGASIFFLLISIADPYLPKTKVERQVESREIVYLIDVSTSKGWLFGNTGLCAGQVGREAMLKFLKMRQGQNDRASLWLFATKPRMIEDFITDDELFFMQVQDAPYVITDPKNPTLPQNDIGDDNSVGGQYLDIVVPPERLELIKGEGSTLLNPALDAIIEHFDKKGNKKIKQKGLIIETDAAVEHDAKEQLEKLQKNNIQVYMLHIKPNEIGESQFGNLWGLVNAERLKKRIKEYGGKIYDIQNSKNIEAAYKDIDRLQRGPQKVTRHFFKVFIYQRPLMVAIILLIAAMLIGPLLHLFFAENP